MRILYPGSFDPLTLGHLDLIERASAIFGEVIVAVLENPQKVSTFTLEKRLHHISSATKHLKGISVLSFDGLTVNCAQENKVDPSISDEFSSAKEKIISKLEELNWSGGFYRKDIGYKVIK